MSKSSRQLMSCVTPRTDLSVRYLAQASNYGRAELVLKEKYSFNDDYLGTAIRMSRRINFVSLHSPTRRYSFYRTPFGSGECVVGTRSQQLSDSIAWAVNLRIPRIILHADYRIRADLIKSATDHKIKLLPENLVEDKYVKEFKSRIENLELQEISLDLASAVSNGTLDELLYSFRNNIGLIYLSDHLGPPDKPVASEDRVYLRPRKQQIPLGTGIVDKRDVKKVLEHCLTTNSRIPLVLKSYEHVEEDLQFLRKILGELETEYTAIEETLPITS